MKARRYVRPRWIQRRVGNQLAARFGPSMIFRLSVAGRHSGRTQTVPVVILHHNGARYVVSVHGDSDWARNLRATRIATLANKKTTESIIATEVPVGERGVLLEAYLAEYGKSPGVKPTLRALPNPADHPIFHIATRG